MEMLESQHGSNFSQILDHAFEKRGYPREERGRESTVHGASHAPPCRPALCLLGIAVSSG